MLTAWKTGAARNIGLATARGDYITKPFSRAISCNG